MIEGGYQTLSAACEAIEADIPVLVFAGSGKAADFIAAAYDRREQPSVYYLLSVISACIVFVHECCCIGQCSALQYKTIRILSTYMRCIDVFPFITSF